ncbi:MAG: polyprenyl synthetase family protein [Hyphomicrobiales bacterium]|nr:polyprenyl synthetase family protein [Hyphomicrobiales bacterium]
MLQAAPAEDMKSLLERLRGSTGRRLDDLLGALAAPPRLTDALRYSALAPAKRIRACLVMAAAAQWGAPEARALDSACAVEMVHAASLILDDLPSMDNAALRRGMSANHRVYGEATAILAAIGLLSHAFGVVARDAHLTDAERAVICDRLSAAIGPGGLVAGQELDLHGAAEKRDVAGVERMYAGKTGALFSVSAEIGAILGGAEEAGREAMRRYGEHLGVAFQTLDDVLDAVGTLQSAGKDVRKDIDRPTLVTYLGVDGAEARAAAHLELAAAAAREAGAGEPLQAFARYLNEAMQIKLFEARRPAAAAGE